MSEPTHEQVADALDDAADLIERDGWCQGKSRDGHGRRCIRGALWGDRLLPTDGPQLRAVEAYLGLETRLGKTFLATWNDAPERTEQEVLDALRGAAKAERRLADEATR